MPSPGEGINLHSGFTTSVFSHMILACYDDSDPARAVKLGDRRWSLENGMWIKSFEGSAIFLLLTLVTDGVEEKVDGGNYIRKLRSCWMGHLMDVSHRE